MTVEQSLRQISRRLAAIERHLLTADETMLTCKQHARRHYLYTVENR